MGGVDENDVRMRTQVIDDLGGLGRRIDQDRNQRKPTAPFAVHQDATRVAILVVPTNEEFEIALQTVNRLSVAA